MFLMQQKIQRMEAKIDKLKSNGDRIHFENEKEMQKYD